MASFNKVILAGNLTRDPQLSVLPSNTSVCEFGMAVNHKWRSQEGEMREDTCFVDMRIFGKRAEVINKYMSKGKPILVEGRLKYDQWEAKDGGKRSKLYVIVENFEFLGGGGGGSGGGGRGGSSSRNDRNADYDEMPPVASGAENADDIPF